MRSSMLGLIVTIGLFGACAAGSAADQQVTLTDVSIEVASVIEAGPVRFLIDNRGSELHEYEVFSGARRGMVLPVSSSVADTSGLRLLDEVENLFPGNQGILTIDLEPGTYLVLCNLPDHYERGMWATIDVVAAEGG